MSAIHDLPQIVTEALEESMLRQHLSDGALVRYHDETLDAASRAIVTLHLERCAPCRTRLDAVTRVHLSEEDLIDYHDGQIRNPHTLARVRGHIEAQHCQSCQTWLEEFRQAETMAAQWVTTHQHVPAETPQRVTVGQRLRAAGERLVAMLTLDGWSGGASVLDPAYATTRKAVMEIPADGTLAGQRQADPKGGEIITLSSEREEHAGGLFAWAYIPPETEGQPLRRFCVLPTTPKRAYCFESVVRVPREDMTSWPIAVSLMDPETLQPEDVAALQWSFCHAADDISREAWRTFCQRHRENSALPQAVRAWCASLVA